MSKIAQPYEELFNLPVKERLRLARRLIDSAISADRDAVLSEFPLSQDVQQTNTLLGLAGRYSGGPGDTAGRAEEILESEVDAKRGLGFH